jgi:predicted transposase YdaD
MKKLMGQPYDNIFKENLETVAPTLLKLLGIQYDSIEDLPGDLQVTLERRPDFTKLIKKGKKEFVWHLEIQTANEPDMVYRMHEYCGILSGKYQKDVRQCVIYIGRQKPQEPPILSSDLWNYTFRLLNFRELDYKFFLERKTPEDAILAILADFGEDAAPKAAQTIVSELSKLCASNFSKYARQLEIFAKLRNLQPVIIELLEDMALYYDLETDIRFLQGKEKGVAEGIEKGKELGKEEGIREGMEKGKELGKEEGIREGMEKGKELGKEEGRQEGRQEGRAERDIEVALNGLAKGVDEQTIADLTGLSLAQIRALKKAFSNGNGASGKAGE